MDTPTWEAVCGRWSLNVWLGGQVGVGIGYTWDDEDRSFHLVLPMFEVSIAQEQA